MPFDGSPPESPAPEDKTLAIFIEARRLLSQPGGWVKGFSALNAEGRECDIYNPEATTFCLLGALYRGTWRRRAFNHVDPLFSELGFPNIFLLTQFNDAQESPEPVIARLDRAIAARRLKLQIKETVDA